MVKQFVSFERLQQYDILIKEFVKKLVNAANGDIATLETAIEILNGNGEGSVQKQITDAINDFATKISDDGVVNNFKELLDYVAQHGQEFQAIFNDVEALKSAVGTPASEEAEATGLYKELQDALEKQSQEFGEELENAKVELQEAIEVASEDVLNKEISANSGEEEAIVAYLDGTVGNPEISLAYEFCSDVDILKLFAVPYVANIGGEDGESLADAISAISSSETVFDAVLTLQDSTPVATSLNIPAGKNVTIDLNGQSLTNAEGTSPAQLLNVLGELTITDSTANARMISANSIVNTASNKTAIKLANANAVLNVEGGLIEATNGSSSRAIYGNTGTVNISGGKIISAGTGVDGKNINISGGEISANGVAVSGGAIISGGVITSETSYGAYANASNCNIEVTGGEISGAKAAVGVYTGNVKVADSAVLNSPIAFASNASGIILAGSSYIPENADLEIYNNDKLIGYFTSETTATSSSALNNATVKLTKDVNAMYNVIGYDMVLDLNGHNISSADTAAVVIKAGSSASKVRNVTITGNGNISCDNGAGCVAVYVDRYANVNIAGGNYSVGGDSDNAVVYIANSYKTAPTVVEISGGSYKSGDDKWILNIKDDFRQSENPDENAKFVVTGGTFNGFNPANCISEGEGTNFVAEGFESVIVDGAYVVRPVA